MTIMLNKVLKFVRYRSLGRSLRSRPLALVMFKKLVLLGNKMEIFDKKIPVFLFFITLQSLNICYADPIEIFKNKEQADGLAAAMIGNITFEGNKSGGSIQYVYNTMVVSSSKSFSVTYESVYLYKLIHNSNGGFSIDSECGVRVPGLGSVQYEIADFNYIHLVNDLGVTKKLYGNGKNTKTYHIEMDRVVECFKKLQSVHNNKNISFIKLSDEKGQEISLSWFSDRKLQIGLDPESWRTKSWSELKDIKQIVIEGDINKNGTPSVQVRKVSSMVCDDGGANHFIQNWKTGYSPWIDLKQDRNGIWVVKGVPTPVFPQFEKSELNTQLMEQLSLPSSVYLEYFVCEARESEMEVRVIRDGEVLYEIVISGYFG